MKFISLIFCFVLVACTSTPKEASVKKELAQYNPLVKDYTKGAQKYKGVYNTYRVNMTLLAPELRQAQTRLLSKAYDWSNEEKENQEEKVRNEVQNKTHVFISFYTPTIKHNDLNRGKKSLWNVFLEYNGTRYPAKISKDKNKLAYIQQLYPHHTQFNRGYIATFDVPVNTISGGSPKVTIAGSLASSTFEFDVN